MGRGRGGMQLKTIPLDEKELDLLEECIWQTLPEKEGSGRDAHIKLLRMVRYIRSNDPITQERLRSAKFQKSNEFLKKYS